MSIATRLFSGTMTLLFVGASLNAQAGSVASAQINMKMATTLTALQNANKSINPSRDLIEVSPTDSTSSLIFMRLTRHADFKALTQKENSAKLRAFANDVVILKMTEKSGQTLVTLDSNSVIGGVAVSKALEICEKKNKAGSDCLDFKMVVTEAGAIELHAHLLQVSSDLENDDADSSVLFRFSPSLTKSYPVTDAWTLKSMYGNGNDVDDVDYIRIGRGLGGGSDERTHAGAHERD